LTEKLLRFQRALKNTHIFTIEQAAKRSLVTILGVIKIKFFSDKITGISCRLRKNSDMCDFYHDVTKTLKAKMYSFLCIQIKDHQITSVAKKN